MSLCQRQRQRQALAFLICPVLAKQPRNAEVPTQGRQAKGPRVVPRVQSSPKGPRVARRVAG